MRRIVCVMLMLLGILAGCGTPTTGTPAATPTPQTQPPAPLQLTIWHSWSGRSAQSLDLLARRFEQDHPDVRIVLESHSAASFIHDYSTSVSDGSAPQMILVLSRYVGDLAGRSQILPLDDRFGEDALKDLLPAAVDSGRVGEQLFAMPVTFDSLVLYYNRNAIPQAPTMVEQVLSTATATDPTTTTPNPALAYYLSAATTLPYVRAFDGAVFDSAGHTILNGNKADGTVRWLEWLQSMRDDTRSVATDDYGAVDALIQANRVNATIDWSHRLADYQQLWGRDAVGITALPRIDQNTAVPSIVLSDALCINPITSAQQRAAATEFMRFMTSADAQAMLWTRGEEMPINRTATVEGAAKDVVAIGGDAFAFPYTLGSTRAWPLLDTMLRSVLSGSATPVEAIDSTNNALQALEATP